MEEHKSRGEKESLRKKRHRKTYVKPKLIEYGQIEKLTESGGTAKNEPHGTRRP